MLCVDVNVLVYAMRDDAEQHDEFRGWLSAACLGPESVGVPAAVLAGTIRVGTNPRIWQHASTPTEALDFVDSLLLQPAVRVLPTAGRTWDICRGLIREIDARGNDIGDALIAASAIEYGAALATRDRGFARFPGLRVVDPLVDGSRR
jgi:toxin-antitoxin system PIN domain toxin